MKKILISAATLAAVLGTTAALAQMPAPMAPQGRAHTRAEVAGHVQTMFARIDANRDGFITKAETAAMRGMASQRKAERRGQRQAQGFERMDTNRDGSISRAEWGVRAGQRQQRMAMRRSGDGTGQMQGMHGKGGMRGMRGFGGRMFDMADANRDGRVTAQEATAAALQHFDMADANRDGQLTRDERMQMHQKMRAMKQRG